MRYCVGALKTSTRSTSLLTRLQAWLSPADAPHNADLIFVLAGKVHRKEYVLELFRQGLAPRLLFSVGRYEIRRFSQMPLPVPLDLLKIAQDVPPPQRHYFVLFQGQEARVQHVLPKRFGTLMEIDALARWLSENPDIRSVLVISSDTHLRRIRMCCRSLLDPKTELTFLAAPLALPVQPLSSVTAERQLQQPQPQLAASAASLKDDLLEVFKLGIYWVLLKTR
jgi:uncharacterized SAM-binding protein YcdF (DUF218 family)